MSDQVDQQELQVDSEFEVNMPHQLIRMEFFLCILHLHTEQIQLIALHGHPLLETLHFLLQLVL